LANASLYLRQGLGRFSRRSDKERSGYRKDSDSDRAD